MKDIKNYKPAFNSLSSGQVLQEPHHFSSARLILQEMVDALALDLVDKSLLTSQLTVTVGYDKENLTDPVLYRQYAGDIVVDGYGRPVPKSAHGTVHLPSPTSSTPELMKAVSSLFDSIVNPKLLVRRLTLTAERVLPEAVAITELSCTEQLDLFSDPKATLVEQETLSRLRQQERKRQVAALNIKKKYGKNALLKGMNLKKGATAITRNEQIGGHKA